MASTSTLPSTQETGPTPSAPSDPEPDKGHGRDAGAATINGHERLDGAGLNGAAESRKDDQPSASATASVSASASASASKSPKTVAADSLPSSPVNVISDIAGVDTGTGDAVPVSTAAPNAAPTPNIRAVASSTVNGIKAGILNAPGPGSEDWSNASSSHPTTPPVVPAHSMGRPTAALQPLPLPLPQPLPPVQVVPSSQNMWNTPPPPPPQGGHNNGRWTTSVKDTKPAAPKEAKAPSRFSSPVPAPSRLPAQIPVVDAAPGTGSPAPAQTAASGFPSPGKEPMHRNSKFIDDRTRITYGIRQALPDAARRAVRDNWEKCLLGSDFHQAFVLNAAIHHTSPASIQRGIRDFGGPLVSSAKHEILDQMTSADLDELTDQLLAKASDHLLDKALERRLKTIDAKRLINALGRAERLGYEQGDVDDSADLPSGQQPAPGYVHAQVAQPSAGADIRRLPPSAAPAPALPLHCDICFRRFAAQSAYDYHIKCRVCTRSPSSPGGFKYNCQHCGQGFTTVMGLQYHNANKICGDFGGDELAKARAAPVLSPLQPPAANRSAGRPSPVLPSTPVPSSQLQSSLSSPVAETPGLKQPNGTIADPYAHLSPEQLAAMQEELRQAEITFSERMRQANLIPDPGEKRSRLDGLANSFGTKQSLIRKKYGVRLRLRRTKEEIMAERNRMTYKTASEIQIEMGIHSGHGPGRPVASSYRPSPPRAGAGAGAVPPGSQPASGWASVNNQPRPTAPPPSTAPAVTLPGPRAEAPTYAGKRAGEGLEPPPPSKRVAYEDVGGGGGGGGGGGAPSPGGREGVGAGAVVDTVGRPQVERGLGTADSPMALDDSDTSDSGDDSGEDIPAQLPASVRQSLQRSSSIMAPRPAGERQSAEE